LLFDVQQQKHKVIFKRRISSRAEKKIPGISQLKEKKKKGEEGGIGLVWQDKLKNGVVNKILCTT